MTPCDHPGCTQPAAHLVSITTEDHTVTEARLCEDHTMSAPGWVQVLETL
jgi:hypothetical protein